MGKRTIKARKINWLRLFLVKILGVAKLGKSHAPQNLSSGLCDFDYRVYTISRGVIVRQRLLTVRIGRGPLTDHRAQALSRSQAGDILIGLSLELLKQSTPASISLVIYP